MTGNFRKHFEYTISNEDVKLWLEIANERLGIVKELFDYFSDKEFLFDNEQFKQIYKGIKAGLKTKEILIYSNPKFISIKMGILRKCLECGMESGLVEVCANTELNYLQLVTVLEWYEKGVKIYEMEPYINQEYNYKQLEVIFRSLLGKIEHMELIANPNYTSYYMDVLRKSILKYDDYVIKYIKKYSKKNFLPERFECILGYACEVPKEYTDRQLDFIANPKFNEEQMDAIADGFKHGLSFEELKVYVQSDLNYLQMLEINNALINRNLSLEQIKPYINAKFDAKQLECIFSGMSNGYDVNIYAKTCYNSEEMCIIYKAIKNELSKDKLDVILNPTLYAKDIDLILKAFRSGVSVEEVKRVCTPKFNEQELLKLIKKYNDIKVENELNQLRKILF